MNFLIAVIVQSYNKVIANKEAFDYQQRASMINERECYFTKEHLSNSRYFPKIIIVKKIKEGPDSQNFNLRSAFSKLKIYFKDVIYKLAETTNLSNNETM